jgi:hypothetical protein
MSNQILISSGAKLRDLDDVIIGTDGVLTSLGFNVANGVPKLDENGKILVSQLPNSVMEFKGVWNAATNTPTLADGTGNAGDVYLCNVAGTVNFGSGPIAFAVGDYAVYTGTVWARSSGATGTVTSVGLSRSGDALTVTGSPITTSGTINIGFAGTNLQYINGAGNLVTFPTIAQEAQRLITEVYNDTGATLTKGTIVYINGGQGNLPTVTKAIATGDSTSAQTYGIVQNDISNMDNGFVVVIGSLTDLDTQAYPEGTQLYLSGTTAGAWTSTKPYAPVHLVYVAIVTRSHPTQGVVEVSIQNGYEMDELHNVAAQNPDNNDILQYKTSTSLWTKVAGTTSNIAEGSNLYFTNARARQSISLTTTGSTGASTYDNVTGVLNIPNYVDQYVGTVTSVGLSAPTGFSVTGSPVTSSGTLALSFASGYSLPTNVKQSNWDDAYTWVAAFPTQTGNAGKFLTTDGSSLSWAANPLGTVTSVAMSVPTGLSVSGSPITTSGTLAVTFAAGYSIPTNASQTNWDTAYTNRITSLTTTGSSGASTLISNTLNIPTYTLAGLGGVPTSRTLTINSVTYDLSADRTWTITAGISSVSGTSPISVSTVSGAATVSIATANTTTTGALTSTDWNTFNGKQNALTNPVTGTGTINTLAKFTATGSTIGNSLFTDNGTNGALGGTNYSAGTGVRTFNITGPSFAGIAFWTGTSQYTADIFAYESTGNLLLNADPSNTLSASNILLNVDDINIAAFNTTNVTLTRGLIGTSATFSGNAGVGISPTVTAGITELAIGSSTTNPRLSGIRDGVSAFALSSDSGATSLFERRNLGLSFGTNNIQRMSITNTGVVELNATDATYIRFSYLGTSKGFIGVAGASTDIISGAAAGDLTIRAQQKMQFATGGDVARLTISSTGLATFSKGITAVEDVKALNFGVIDTTFRGGLYTYKGISGGGTDFGITIFSEGGTGNGNIYFCPNGSVTKFMSITTSNTLLVNTASGVTGGGTLQVNGNVNINGLFQINGVTIGGGGGSGVTGSGTAGFITRWTGSSTLANGNIYDDGTNIGINTTSLSGLLTLRATVTNTPTISFQNVSGGPNSAISNFTSAAQTYTVIGTNAYVNNTANIARFNTSYAGCYIAFDEGTMVFGSGSASETPSGRMFLSPAGLLTVNNTIRTQNYGILRAGSFRGGLYTYDAITGSGTDYGLTLFAEGGTGNGNIYFCPNGSVTKVMTINTSSNVLIGTTTDNGYKLQINGSASFAYGFLSIFRGSSGANDIFVGNDGSRIYIGGNTYVVGNVTATGGFFDTSDARLKTLVEDNYLLSSIANVKARLYIKDGRKELGYYAQDLEAILPSAVKEGSDGFLSLSYAQVHTAKIAVIEDEVTILKNRVSELESKLQKYDA